MSQIGNIGRMSRIQKAKYNLRRAGRQFRMWLPTMPIFLVAARNRTPRHPLYATFRCPPRMTKHEIKEYLTKIYQLPVRKINTMNYMGPRKRVQGRRGTAYFKYVDFKKAVVFMDENKMPNVGIGTKIPELDKIWYPEAAQPGEVAQEQKQIGGG